MKDTIWVALLTEGNSIMISGTSFKVGVPEVITKDLADMLLKDFVRSFRVWEQPEDVALPNRNKAVTVDNTVKASDIKNVDTMANTNKRKMSKDSVKNSIVKPSDTLKEESGDNTHPDSWPKEVDDVDIDKDKDKE